MRKITAVEVSRLVSGELHGDGQRVINRVSRLEDATGEALAFVANARYVPYLEATQAGIVLVGPSLLEAVPERCTAVVVADPHQALHEILSHLYPQSRPPAGVHPSAVIASTARLADDVSVGPYAVVGEEAEIGSGCSVGAHAVIGRRCRLGRDVVVHGQATLYDGVTVHDRVIIHSGARVGKDGFGFVWQDGGHRKIPQVGGCIIEEDVEIGANSTIDRGSVGDTVVGAGTKIDNLVQVGHNCRIGEHVLLVSQVGLAGSTIVGDGAVLGGQVGVGGHLTIGAGARLGAQAGVIGDIPEGESYSGYPARPHREAMRAHANVFKLPEFIRRLKRLEERVFGNG